MGKTRESANLVSEYNIFVDISNDRVGLGTTVPSTKLDVDGTVKAIDFNSTSDEKLKENIKVIENPIDKVLKINGVTFDWKQSQKPSVGVIAQEVEKVFPQLVDGKDTKTVNYNGLIGVLIEVVKEQQDQITILSQEIQKLKENNTP